MACRLGRGRKNRTAIKISQMANLRVLLTTDIVKSSIYVKRRWKPVYELG